MALNGAVLYNSTGQYLNLNDFAGGYGIDWSAAIGHSDIRRTITKPWQRGYDPLSAVSWGNRVIKLPLHFGGTSLDSWSQNYQAVRNVLAESERWYASNGTDGAQTWLAVQLNGQTNPLVFDVIGGDIDIDSGSQKYFGPTMVSTTSPKLPATPVILFCRPFAHPQAQQSLNSPTITLGNSQTGKTPFYLQPTALGNWEAPARFSTAPSVAYRYLTVARRSQGNVGNFIWPYLFTTNHPTTQYTTAIGNYAGQTSVTTTSGWSVTNTVFAASNSGYVADAVNSGAIAAGTTYGATWTFTVSGNLIDQIGNHRMMALVRGLNNANLAAQYYLQMAYAGPSGTTVYLPEVSLDAAGTAIISPSLGTTISSLVDIGVLPVNYPQTGNPGAFKFTVSVRSQNTSVGNIAAGTAVLRLDCVFPMPLDEQQFQFRNGNTSTSTFTANTSLVKDDLSLIPSYANLDTAGDQTTAIVVPDYDSGRFLMPLAPQAWFPLWWNSGYATLGAAVDFASTSTLNIKYAPLFEVTN